MYIVKQNIIKYKGGQIYYTILQQVSTVYSAKTRNEHHNDLYVYFSEIKCTFFTMELVIGPAPYIIYSLYIFEYVV